MSEYKRKHASIEQSMMRKNVKITREEIKNAVDEYLKKGGTVKKIETKEDNTFRKAYFLSCGDYS